MIHYNIEKSIQKLFKQSYTFVFDTVLSFGSHDKDRQQEIWSNCGDITPFSSGSLSQY